MIRILYTVNGLRVNGMSAVILQYIANLNKNEYSFTLFTDEIESQYEPLLEVNCVKVIQSHNRKRNPIAYYKELSDVIKEGRYDIIHAHGNSATIGLEMLAAKMHDISVRIAHSHNTTCMHPMIDRLLRPLLYGTYTHGIACGVEAGKWLFKGHNHIVIKNGIDLKKFSFQERKRSEVRKALNLTNQYVIGHIGRFTEQKNHRMILQIFKHYLKNHEAVLLLVGNGPKETEIRKLASELRISDKVIFYGITSDTSPLYSAMDIFLFPSKFEGVPLTLIEAQANGLPCLISDTISPEVMITDLITSLPLSDEMLWSDRLNTVVDRPLASRIAIEKLTETGFELKTVITQIDQLYKSAVVQSQRHKR